MVLRQPNCSKFWTVQRLSQGRPADEDAPRISMPRLRLEPKSSSSPRAEGSTRQKAALLSYRTNFYRSVPKAEKMGLRSAARMDSPATFVKGGNKFAGVQQEFARSQSKDSFATAQPAKRAAELKSTFRGGVTVSVCTNMHRSRLSSRRQHH